MSMATARSNEEAEVDSSVNTVHNAEQEQDSLYNMDDMVEKTLTDYKHVVGHLTWSEKMDMENSFLSEGVKIQIQRGIGAIKLEGSSTNVTKVELLLKTRIQDLTEQKQQLQLAKTVAEYVQWNYEPFTGDDIFLEEYDVMTNLILEEAFRDNKSEVKLSDPEGVESIVKFDEMIEYIQNIEADRVKVIRRQIKEGNPFEVRNDNSKCLEEKEKKKEISEAGYTMVRDSYWEHEVVLSSDIISTFNDQEVWEIEEVDDFTNVVVDTEQGKIKLSGPPRLVAEAEVKIDRQINHIKRRRELADLDKKPGVVVTWSYDLDDTGAESHAYEETTNAAIEKAYRRLQDEITITFLETKTSFVVDFVDMIEYAKHNTNDYVKVYRKVTSEDDSVNSKDKLEDTLSSKSLTSSRLPNADMTKTRSDIRSLNAEQVADLEQIHSAAVINVVKSENKITISGRPRVAEEANIRVDRYLRHMRRERQLKQEACYNCRVIEWSYEAVDSISGKLVPIEFTEDINSAIEHEYMHMQDEMILFDKETQGYLIVDFIDMVVYREEDRSCYNGLHRAIHTWINT